MAIWIDYLAAAVVVGVLLFILFAGQMRGQTASVDAVQYRAAKQSALNFASMIEHDFNNIGAQHPNYDCLPNGDCLPKDAILEFDTTSTTRVFKFYAQTQRGQPPEQVTYTWEEDGTAQLESGPVPLYTMERRVNGVLAGMTTGISFLEIYLRKADSTPIFNLEDTREVAVRLRAVSPLGPGQYIEETRWSTTLHPIGMRRKDF